jgi:hypothetical protein
MSLTFIHEFNQHQQHRLVAVADNGTNDAGEWCHISEIAHLRDVYASADTKYPFGQGVFTIRDKAHQVLA